MRAGFDRDNLAFLALVMAGCWAGSDIFAQSATFDFDTGTPRLPSYWNLPIDQTVGGVTAHFSAIAGDFSIQSDDTTGFILSQFDDNYLYPNTTRGSALRIQFSQELIGLQFNFATTDYRPAQPTSLALTAFFVAPGSTNMVGSTTSRATYGNDKFPMGTLVYNIGTKPFNRVEVGIPTGGNATFLLDNVIVHTIPELRIDKTDPQLLVISWPWPSTGFELQQSDILAPSSWITLTNAIEVVDERNQVTLSSTAGAGFYRLHHP